MRIVLQRVKSARVDVAGETVGSIGAGLVILLGVTQSDNQEDADYLADKVVQLRIFADEAGRMLVKIVRLAVANAANRTGKNLTFLIHLPAQDGDDWNRVLQRVASGHRQDETKFGIGAVRDRTAPIQSRVDGEASDGMKATR